MSMSMPEMATEAKAGIGICPRCAISNCSSIRGVAATVARGRKIGGDALDERADMCRDSKRYSVSVLARHRHRHRLRLRHRHRRCHSH